MDLIIHSTHNIWLIFFKGLKINPVFKHIKKKFHIKLKSTSSRLIKWRSSICKLNRLLTRFMCGLYNQAMSNPVEANWNYFSPKKGVESTWVHSIVRHLYPHKTSRNRKIILKRLFFSARQVFFVQNIFEHQSLFPI